jgi:phospholipid N-methyltransferase
MIEIKFVDEFIERHRKIGDVIPTDARNFGKVLRA